MSHMLSPVPFMVAIQYWARAFFFDLNCARAQGTADTAQCRCFSVPLCCASLIPPQSRIARNFCRNQCLCFFLASSTVLNHIMWVTQGSYWGYQNPPPIFNSFLSCEGHGIVVKEDESSDPFMWNVEEHLFPDRDSVNGIYSNGTINSGCL